MSHKNQSRCLLCVLAGTLELKASNESAHSRDILCVAYSPDGKTIVSGSYEQTIKVWDAGVSTDTDTQSHSNLSTPLLATASLELKAEKQSAHSDWIRSVAFNNDGTKIVSGSDDQTIKVWDAVNFRPHVESEWEQFDKTVKARRAWEVDKVEQWWRNIVTAHEQATKPSGGACCY